MAVPMRTSVAPYLTATCQSSLMPMLSSLKYSLSSKAPSLNVYVWQSFGQFTGLASFQHFFHAETAFGLLLCYMQLEQYINSAVNASCFFFNETEQFHAVNALDDCHMGHDGAHLVLLQVTDEVPTDILGQQRGLGYQFLGAVLAEQALSGLVSFGKFLNGMKL